MALKAQKFGNIAKAVTFISGRNEILYNSNGRILVISRQLCIHAMYLLHSSLISRNAA